jgi:integrase
MALANRLNDKKVRAASKPGMYGDGGNLYLMVDRKDPELKSWVFRFEVHGKRRHMGLGAFPKVSLAKARELRDDARKLVAAGTDPIIARGGAQQAAAAVLSVKQACERYLEAQKAKWKTADHIKQIRQRLRDFVFPVIGHLPIGTIGVAEAKQVLAPIWTAKNPTAGRTRQYLEDVINWAAHEGFRSEDLSNPFDVERLKWALPLGIHEVKSHPALSYTEAPAFLAELRFQDGVKARALELTLLCATRIGDIVGGGKAHSEPMKWSHVDLAEKTWTVPDTKMGRPHVVPLSDAAMTVLAQMQRHRDPATDYVFPGAKRGTVLSDATLRYLIAAMGYQGIATTHGMRSTFKTWAEEVGSFDTLVVEAALAHAKKGMAAPYHRGDYLRKRRVLMAAWAAFLEGEAMGSVVPMRA